MSFTLRLESVASSELVEEAPQQLIDIAKSLFKNLGYEMPVICAINQVDMFAMRDEKAEVVYRRWSNAYKTAERHERAKQKQKHFDQHLVNKAILALEQLLPYVQRNAASPCSTGLVGCLCFSCQARQVLAAAGVPLSTSTT